MKSNPAQDDTAWRSSVYALTGGIGSGKSTVGKMLADLGAFVLKADDLARLAVVPGSIGLSKIIKCFGQEIIGTDGALNRRELAAVVFKDPAKRSMLESILHPIIRELAGEKFSTAIAEGLHPLVYEIPLLFEIGAHKHGFKGIIVVSAPEELMIQRAASNLGINFDEAKSRYESQIPIQTKISQASFVIHNHGSLEQLDSQVKAIFALINK